MTHRVKFSKMHGLGNDLVIIDAVTQSNPISYFPVRDLANRKTGIGFDQLLIITPSSQADFACQIFNSDGSEAEQCGNGMRCIGRFIHEKQLSDKKTLAIETRAGIAKITVHDFNRIEVNMGVPMIQKSQEILVNDHVLQLGLLSLGNPHAILIVPNVKNVSMNLGEKISQHAIFPHGVNVGFMEIVNRQHIRLRTFERGAGETLACGSNSCAAVIAGISQGALDKSVQVELALGNLKIDWQGEGQPVFMTGPAEQVFDGVR